MLSLKNTLKKYGVLKEYGVRKMPKEKDDVLICRCNEVSLKEIKEAIKEGARTVKDVKRRTRAKWIPKGCLFDL